MRRAETTHCPWLPVVEEVLDAASMAAHRGFYGEAFYLAALTYAQSLWLQGKPAQAILQLNKAWSADLTGNDSILRDWPSPYRALAWILRHTGEEGFLGNPVRHFQHLATRMSGRNAEERIWRAWACFWLSECLLDAETFPRDEEQIRKEKLTIPTLDFTLARLAQLGWPGEAEECKAVFLEAEPGVTNSCTPAAQETEQAEAADQMGGRLGDDRSRDFGEVNVQFEIADVG